MNCQEKKSASQLSEAELFNHLLSLELETIDAYRQWCEENGFQPNLDKDHLQRRQEQLHHRQSVTTTRLQINPLDKQELVDQLSAVCNRDLNGDTLVDPFLRQIWELYYYGLPVIDRSALIRKSFLELIVHLRFCKADFFDDTPAIAQLGTLPGNRYLEALVLIAAEADSWLRPIEDWRPRMSDPRRQFASLLRHLFVEYQMPFFFDSVWLMNWPWETSLWRKWYIYVGLGYNIRQCPLPISFTKKMAHHFMHAPPDITMYQAIRWGQILGMGGDEALAREIFATRLAEEFLNEDFWSSVLHWFVRQPRLDRVHVRPIIDYLYFQRFGMDLGNSALSMPLQEYSMKGRTPRSLLHQVQEWHRGLAENDRIPFYEWEPSRIPGFEYREAAADGQNWRYWTIRELLTSHALVAEGREMKHCVATYAFSCARGSTSIWTMEVKSAEGVQKAVTIEVNCDRKLICQVRGLENRMPEKAELAILNRWAIKARLDIAETL
ncbi:PcfJ domain-containing protein [Gimesia panareensis]|uniref:PcfJ domain-containing protein n=1 Tax=Gimesia panareensis TaxID=2527978 RepID=UPI00118A18E6|nr:PcfJ domain-containing protein [Gimesia panareensis]QDU51697.1 hypothetical protein Pan110_40640 [Gimesia panareensis]